MAFKGSYIKRGMGSLKRNGLKQTVFTGIERLGRDAAEKDYRHISAGEDVLEYQRRFRFDRPYKISILVPVYETDPVVFKKMLESVGEQTYGNWELILADGSRDESRRDIVRKFTEEHSLLCSDDFGSIYDKVIYLRAEGGHGISENTNLALSHATGDYVALLDHDDILENTALFDIMSAVEKKERYARQSETISKTVAIYTDEDKVSEDGRIYHSPHLKGGFDPVLLLTNNYICHFFVVDTNVAKGVGGFRPEYDGAQDHDFILRCTEGLDRDQIIHVPKVLYHWRVVKGSTSADPGAKLYAYEAGKRAVADHLKRLGIGAKVYDSPHLGFFRIQYDRFRHPVKTVNGEELLKMENSHGKSGEDEFVMILSSDLRPLDPDYIADMMSAMQLPGIGAVTGRILAEWNKTESAGYDRDPEGRVTPRFSGLFGKFSGYMHRADLDQTVDAFDPDCVLLRTDAVERYYPEPALKKGFDVYYMSEAVFKRKIQ